VGLHHRKSSNESAKGIETSKQHHSDRSKKPTPKSYKRFFDGEIELFCGGAQDGSEIKKKMHGVTCNMKKRVCFTNQTVGDEI